MKLIFELSDNDGGYLAKETVDWTSPFIPNIDDWLQLDNFMKSPKKFKSNSWQVESRHWIKQNNEIMLLLILKVEAVEELDELIKFWDKEEKNTH